MATRFYLPSTGSASVNPSPLSGWNNTTNFDRIALVTTKIGSTMTSKAQTSTSLDPEYHLSRQFVSIPIVGAQTITGTIKGYIRTIESTGAFNGRLAIGIQIVAGDGVTQRGVALAAPTWNSDTGNYEFPIGGLTNRPFLTTGDTTPI